ncbi:MAG: hypothetical protein OEZ34_07840 [Spirochaetia bacterium]|nr:hypothetical protein [Spirochaetia bacterium]
MNRSHIENFMVFDYANIFLIAVTLLIDLIIIAGTVYWFTFTGLTPFSIDGLFINLLIFLNLSVLLYHYILFFQKKEYLRKTQ